MSLYFKDFGYVQLSATDKLKSYILNEPAVVRSPENQTSGLVSLQYLIPSTRFVVKPEGGQRCIFDYF